MAVFFKSQCKIYPPNLKLVLQGDLFSKGIYKLNTEVSSEKGTQPSVVLFSAKSRESIDLWHRRLGHMNQDYLHVLKK